jgi:c-di-AMP phosphodiesterase-like protein
VLASSFAELLNSVKTVIVMGHKYSDMDSLGACVGIACIGRSFGKKTHILLDTETNLAETLYERLADSKLHSDIFISKQDAMMTVDLDTLLVIVDTHRASYTEMPELIQYAGKVAVIDHHRKSADYIKDTSFFFHEPYASSACEMVAEILQYIGEGLKLKPLEADAMYAGVMIDTNNFLMKTGVRTFEAAAFIRKAGADTIEVKKLFREDMDNYFDRCRIITSAECYHDTIAIAFSHDNVPRPIAAQAADELLSVNDMDASFVVFRSADTTHISGRSLGDVNIQMIVEQLGGGGSLTTGAAQLGDIPMEKASEMLKMAIDTYYSKV